MASRPSTTLSNRSLRRYTPSTPERISRPQAMSRSSRGTDASILQDPQIRLLHQQQVAGAFQHAVVVDHDRRRLQVAQMASQAERRAVAVALDAADHERVLHHLEAQL